ncbi:pullulanase 1, chloroplastic [Tanacetum coccineum]
MYCFSPLPRLPPWCLLSAIAVVDILLGGNSHCLAQVYEITVIAGITKTSNVQEHYPELYSSVLFCLRTANAIQGRLQFHNTDTSHIPAVILMSIEDVHDGVPGLTQLNPMSGKRSIRRIEGLRYGVLGISWSREHVSYLPEYFISIWLEYGVLVIPGYGVLILFPSWPLVKCRHIYFVSSLMDTAYWLLEQ